MNTFTRIASLTVLTIVVASPPVLFYGMKVSPLSWQLLDPANNDSGLMVKGYDVVAYFNDGRAIKGDTGKGLKWNNGIWYFSSDANKLMFKTFPEKFIPRYGGYCASAIASGFTADIDPVIWHIDNGKLYLFYDEAAKADFVTSINNGIVEKADARWRHQYE